MIRSIALPLAALLMAPAHAIRSRPTMGSGALPVAVADLFGVPPVGAARLRGSVSSYRPGVLRPGYRWRARARFARRRRQGGVSWQGDRRQSRASALFERRSRLT